MSPFQNIYFCQNCPCPLTITSKAIFQENLTFAFDLPYNKVNQINQLFKFAKIEINK